MIRRNVVLIPLLALAGACSSPGTTPGPDAGAACGTAGQVCCNGTACNSGLTCDTSGLCDAICGNLGEVCCNGTACNASLVCGGNQLCGTAGNDDGGTRDAGPGDAGTNPSDAGSGGDAGMDAGVGDAGPPDGGSTNGGSDAGLIEVNSTTYPAFTPDVPQVAYLGGAVLRNPLVVPIFFLTDNTTIVSELIQFLSDLNNTAYWNAVTEYGVGPLGVAAPFVAPTPSSATITDADIQSWLLNEMQTDPTFPQPTANTIYVLHYPSGIRITLPNGNGTSQQSCADFPGYHSDVAWPATATEQPDAGLDMDAGPAFVANPFGSSYGAYIVLPRCNSLGPVVGLDAITGAESAQLVDAATDPYPDFDPAYAQVDNNHFAWGIALGGGEIGSLCSQNPGAYTKFSWLPFTVQRFWSNSNAREGHDPCQPELPGEVYFNSMPVQQDTTTLSEQGESITFESTNVPLETSKTILLALFSDAATTSLGGAWSVQVTDLNQFQGGSANVIYTLNPTGGVNGNQLALTIAPQKAGQYGFNLYVVTSTLGSASNLWVGTVGK